MECGSLLPLYVASLLAIRRGHGNPVRDLARGCQGCLRQFRPASWPATKRRLAAALQSCRDRFNEKGAAAHLLKPRAGSAILRPANQHYWPDRGWALSETFFYTGIPDPADKPFWNHFWTAKLAVMGREAFEHFPVLFGTATKPCPFPEGGPRRYVVRMTRENLYDVASIFSQDQDLSEAADEVKAISPQQDRWIKVACAFPVSPTAENRRGINGTDWIRIGRATYDACLDPNDYRPKP